MKKYLLLLVTAAAAMAMAVSCEKDTKYKLSLDKEELTFNAEASPAQTIKVTAENVEWSITEADSWIHAVKDGDAISVTVDDYDGTQEKREGKFTVASGSKNAPDVTVKVTQNPVALSYSLKASPRLLEFGDTGNEPQIVTVTAENVNWDIEVVNGPVAWLHLEKKEGLIEVTVDDSREPKEREASFLVTSDIPSVNSLEVTVRQKEYAQTTVFLAASGRHWGNDPGADHFLLTFDPLVYDPETYMPTNDGCILYLDFFSEAPQDMENPTIAPGTYTIGDDVAPFVIRPDHTWMRVIAGGGEMSMRSVYAGSVTVERSGGEYVIAFNLQAMDLFFQTDHVLTGIYRGDIPIRNKFLGNLKEDFQIPQFTAGYVKYWGDDVYWNVEAIDWDARLWTDGIISDEYGNLSGNGYYVDLEFLAPLGSSTTVLPAGTYPINGSFEAGTAIAGHLASDIVITSCWVFQMVDGMIQTPGAKISPMKSGEIRVSYSDGNYTFTIDAKDDREYRITGSYTGAMDYYNGTSSDNSTGIAKPKNSVYGQK